MKKNYKLSKLLMLCLFASTLIVMDASAAPPLKVSASISKPLTPAQKQLHTALMHELDSGQNLTVAQMQEIERLLKAGAPLNVPDAQSGLLPLMVATLDARLLQLFLRYGADPNLTDHSDNTSLHIAAMMGVDGTAQPLIRADAKLEARNKSGETPLLAAASQMAELSNARALVAAGAKLEARDNRGMTPLLAAATIPNGAPLTKLLLTAGAKIEVRDKDGSTPLIAAATMNHADIVALLIEHGANVRAHDKRGIDAITAVQALSIMATISTRDGKRPLTPEEQKQRRDAQRIVRLLKQAMAHTKAKKVVQKRKP